MAEYQIYQQSNFKISKRNNKCCTRSEIGGYEINCMRGDYILRYKYKIIFTCCYFLEVYGGPEDVRLYNIITKYPLHIIQRIFKKLRYRCNIKEVIIRKK